MTRTLYDDFKQNIGDIKIYLLNKNIEKYGLAIYITIHQFLDRLKEHEIADLHEYKPPKI